MTSAASRVAADERLRRRLDEKRLRMHAKRPLDSEGRAGEEAAGVAALGAGGGAGQYERQLGPQREPGAELDR